MEDLSSQNFLYQRHHVINTLKSISESMGIIWDDIKTKIVNVGNKLDVQEKNTESILRVSVKTRTGKFFKYFVHLIFFL